VLFTQSFHLVVVVDILSSQVVSLVVSIVTHSCACSSLETRGAGFSFALFCF